MRKEEENGSQVMAAWYESTFELRHVFGATLGCNSTLNQFIEKCIHVGVVDPKSAAGSIGFHYGRVFAVASIRDAGEFLAKLGLSLERGIFNR